MYNQKHFTSSVLRCTLAAAMLLATCQPGYSQPEVEKGAAERESALAKADLMTTYVQVVHSYFPTDGIVDRVPGSDEVAVADHRVLQNGVPTTRSAVLVTTPNGTFADSVTTMLVTRVRSGKTYRSDVTDLESGFRTTTAYDGKQTRVRLAQINDPKSISESTYPGTKQEPFVFSPALYAKKAKFYAGKFEPQKTEPLAGERVKRTRTDEGETISAVFAAGRPDLLEVHAQSPQGTDVETYEEFTTVAGHSMPTRYKWTMVQPDGRPIRTIIFDSIEYQVLSPEQASRLVVLEPAANAKPLHPHMNALIKSTGQPISRPK